MSDDTKPYSLKKPESPNVSYILSWLDDTKNWMSNKLLQWKDSRSERIVITPPGPGTCSIINLSSLLVPSCFVQARYFRKIICRSRKSHRCIYLLQTRLCSTLFFVVTRRQSIQRLQLIQNTAGRLLISCNDVFTRTH